MDPTHHGILKVGLGLSIILSWGITPSAPSADPNSQKPIVWASGSERSPIRMLLTDSTVARASSNVIFKLSGLPVANVSGFRATVTAFPEPIGVLGPRTKGSPKRVICLAKKVNSAGNGSAGGAKGCRIISACTQNLQE